MACAIIARVGEVGRGAGVIRRRDWGVYYAMKIIACEQLNRKVSMRNAMKRELRVAFSRKAQPVWFRITKWIVIIGISALLWRKPTFWFWILGALGLGLTVHIVWRWQTKGWTRPWGGWDDVEAAEQGRLEW